MGTLSPPHREAVAAIFVHGDTYASAAARLGVPVGAQHAACRLA